jgi:hypothetical protein
MHVICQNVLFVCRKELPTNSGKPEKKVKTLRNIEDVQLISHRDEVLQATAEAIESALTLIGIEWSERSADMCPVVTGRLHNSITYATTNGHGNGRDPHKPEDVKPKATPKKSTVVVGTNVEYAQRIEEGGAKEEKHTRFIRRGLTENVNDYKDILKNELSGN